MGSPVHVEQWRARWLRRPDLFMREALGFEPWEDEPGHDSQADMARDVPTHRRMSGRSGHKTGKSRFLAAIALWAYVLLIDGVRIVLTAPTWTQVDEVVWREIGILWRAARKRGLEIGGRLYKTADNGIEGPGDRQIFGRSTDQPDNFSGISAPLVVYIVDEGSGVADNIAEAIEGNLAGGGWFISMGNPTQLSGWFYRSHHEESHLWKTYHLNSERTPTARGKRVVPGLAAPEYINGRRAAWGVDDPRYHVRVLGNFPAHGARSVVSLKSVTEAMARWVAEPILVSGVGMPRLEVGLDCARFGDDKSVLVPRRGLHAGLPESTGGMDSIQLAGWARTKILAMRTHREVAGYGEKPRVKVDTIGIGAGVFDQLHAIAPELEVVGVNVAESATSDDDPGYTNLRAQISFAVEAWLKAGGMLPPDPEMKADLLAAQYGFDVQGRLKVESKDDIKERLGRSPDKGDALALSIYEGGTWTPSALWVK